MGIQGRALFGIEGPADKLNGPNGDKTWDWNFEKMFILGFRHVRQQKT